MVGGEEWWDGVGLGGGAGGMGGCGGGSGVEARPHTFLQRSNHYKTAADVPETGDLVLSENRKQPPLESQLHLASYGLSLLPT